MKISANPMKNPLWDGTRYLLPSDQGRPFHSKEEGRSGCLNLALSVA